MPASLSQDPLHHLEPEVKTNFPLYFGRIGLPEPSFCGCQIVAQGTMRFRVQPRQQPWPIQAIVLGPQLDEFQQLA